MNLQTQYNTFKQWMHDNYDHSDWENIEHSGCINGVSGLIYYSETVELYDAFADEMHEVIAEYKEMTGEMPDYIVKNLDNATSFKNAVVWFVAEWYADEYMTNARTREEEMSL